MQTLACSCCAPAVYIHVLIPGEISLKRGSDTFLFESVYSTTEEQVSMVNIAI